MKQKVFFITNFLLREYLNKYCANRTIDHELRIALYANEWWGKKLNEEFVIALEQNNKMHHYPDRFTLTIDQIKEILETYLVIDTPVDFALAPVNKMQDYDRFCYPFQVKQLRLFITKDIAQELADFISEKANKYKDTKTCFIIDPQLDGGNIGNQFSLDDLKEKLTVRDDAIRAIYIFQSSSVDNFTFLLLWKSPLLD